MNASRRRVLLVGVGAVALAGGAGLAVYRLRPDPVGTAAVATLLFAVIAGAAWLATGIGEGGKRKVIFQ